MLTVWRSTRVDCKKLEKQQFSDVLPIVVLKNFAKFTGKYLRRSFFQVRWRMTVSETADVRSFLEIISVF